MKRRLAAILIADVSGFSRMMEADEVGALAALNARWREILEPAVEAHDGRIVKYLGDGALVEFASVVDAVEAALRLQRGMKAADAGVSEDRRIRLRVAVNFGDVIGEGEDVYGDGVNVAARLEPLAEPGGVCVSGKVRDEVDGKIDCRFRDLGERALKNISRPVRVWQVATDEEAAATPSAPPVPPDRPSIAVVPFQNMSADPEQEYFADGIVEDIITELSRLKWLLVISRNSSFAYKAPQIDIRKVGRELGVRYVLEGSVRRAGSRLRITGQLIDATTGAHLWADRFDGALEDVFDLQDQVTERVVGAIGPRVEMAEMERASRKPTESLDAYDHYLRGMAAFNRFEREANREALREFGAAIELDPAYAPALGMAARAYGQRKGFGWMENHDAEAAEAVRLAREAAKHGWDDAGALASAGFACGLFGALEEGDALLDRAVALSPNVAGAWQISAMVKAFLGQVDLVEERAQKGLRLSPQDPQGFGMNGILALGRLLTGRDEEAYSAASAGFSARPDAIIAAMPMAAASARTDRPKDAARAVARLRAAHPGFRIATIRQVFDFRREVDIALLSDALRRAGLPE